MQTTSRSDLERSDLERKGASPAPVGARTRGPGRR